LNRDPGFYCFCCHSSTWIFMIVLDVLFCFVTRRKIMRLCWYFQFKCKITGFLFNSVEFTLSFLFAEKLGFQMTDIITCLIPQCNNKSFRIAYEYCCHSEATECSVGFLCFILSLEHSLPGWCYQNPVFKVIWSNYLSPCGYTADLPCS
jgi:hypothetical protein